MLIYEYNLKIQRYRIFCVGFLICKINYFRLQYPNEADNINVLLKWTKPINEWEEEVVKIHKFQKHFKNILKNTDQPTVGDLLGDKYKIRYPDYLLSR